MNEAPDEELANVRELHDQDVKQANLVPDNSEEDDDVSEDTTRSENQRQERSQRRQSRRNNSSSSTGTVQQKSRMEINLESKLGEYWNVNVNDHYDTDGSSFAMMVAE